MASRDAACNIGDATQVDLNLAPAGAPAPILVLETTWTGTTHAPGNGATIQTIALAFTDHPIHVFAEAGHLAELRRNAALMSSGQIQFHEITVSRHFAGRTGIVSFRRLAHEAATVRYAFRVVRPRGACLLVLLSATSTAIFAASLAGSMVSRAPATR